MKFLVVIVLGICLSSGAAWADLIQLDTAYSTGVNVTQNTSGGADNGYYYDTKWTLESYTNFYTSGTITTTPYASTSHAYVVTSYPGPNTGYWVNNSSAASWIAPDPVQGNGGAGTTGELAGVYDYQLSFAVTGNQKVVISGMIAADNQFAIVYNGTTVEVSGPSGGTSTDPTSSNYFFSKTESTSTNPTSQFGGSYGSNAPIAFSFTLTATGTSTIDFFVNNFPEGTSSQDNASGLFVEDFVVEAVPEPSTWAIVIMGLGLLAFARYRAQRGKPAAATAGIVTIPGTGQPDISRRQIQPSC
jgi:hypothetical protein